MTSYETQIQRESGRNAPLDILVLDFLRVFLSLCVHRTLVNQASLVPRRNVRSLHCEPTKIPSNFVWQLVLTSALKNEPFSSESAQQMERETES